MVLSKFGEVSNLHQSNISVKIKLFVFIFSTVYVCTSILFTHGLQQTLYSPPLLSNIPFIVSIDGTLVKNLFIYLIRYNLLKLDYFTMIYV